jgi:hypothetical protein
MTSRGLSEGLPHVMLVCGVVMKGVGTDNEGERGVPIER